MEGTTNLRRHLEKKHLGLFNKYNEEDTAAEMWMDAAESQQQKQPSTVAPIFIDSSEKFKTTSKRVMELMALDDMLFNTVQGLGFKRLIKWFSPQIGK